ncbi:AAA family ATPase [Lutibacter sp.]
MIKKIELKKFKKYKNQIIHLRSKGITILAGGNNSGKSTLLHAIAVWEFSKLILELEKGKKALLADSKEQGLGISADEFLPIAIPTLKHLWTNLKTQKDGEDNDGYNLKIKCFWDIGENEKYLEISLSLVNDRLFIKATSSNLLLDDYIPTAAYLPTFAGILEKENKVSLAERRKYIGKGLAGSVLRNLLLELYENNQKVRNDLKNGKSKISSKELKNLRETDPFELLLKSIRTYFKTSIRIKKFNDLYHTAIKIDSFKGEFTDKGIFKKFPTFNYRDLMVEGSGFLQWLNVFTLSLNPDIDIILLDEPDAHLHPSLQIDLINELSKISKNKQTLIATHSSEIIRYVNPYKILNINKSSPKYLKEEKQKVGLLAGIGANYLPKIDNIKRTKKVLFVEGEIDLKLLKKVGELIGEPINNEIIPWITSSGHKERKHLFLELKKEIPELKGLSVRDRDDEGINTVQNDLIDKVHDVQDENLKIMKWKRRNLESYLILPNVISKITNVSIEEINTHITEKFGIVIAENYKESNAPDAVLHINGKKNLLGDENSIFKKYGVTIKEIITNLTKNDICEDLITMVKTINSHFVPPHQNIKHLIQKQL